MTTALDANSAESAEVCAPRLIVGTCNEGVIGVTAEGFALPPTVTIILRDYEAGNEPDANGDLYEDTEL